MFRFKSLPIGVVLVALRASAGNGTKERLKEKPETAPAVAIAKAPSALASNHCEGDWKELVKAQDGWCVHEGKVLLKQCSKKYKQPIYNPRAAAIPFNETADWDANQDHWFEVPLDTKEVREEIGYNITGRIFTTQMPRGIDATWKTDPMKENSGTRVASFRNKCRNNSITKIFVLVEDHELAKGGSAELFEFYKAPNTITRDENQEVFAPGGGCGVEVFHRPIEDHNLPSVEAEAKNVEEIVLSLWAGHNVLIHCWGGSGRTGMVLIGALKQLGIDHPIRYARRFKSVYLDIAEQEQFVESMHFTLTHQMIEANPRLATIIALEHIEDLCNAAEAGTEFVRTAELPVKSHFLAFYDDDKAVLRKLFDRIDTDGRQKLDLLALSGLGTALTKSGLAAARQRILDLESLGSESEDISFDMFCAMMSYNPPSDNKVALTKADIPS